MVNKPRKRDGAPLLARLLRLTSKIEPEEVWSCVLSFLLILMLMSSYYILRPVRDGLASDWTDAEVSALWTLNFFISAAAVALYGWAVTWIRFDWLVRSVYLFFAGSFAVYYLAVMDSAHGDHVWLDKGFYVWVSVFSLFHVSVFWSFMADLFNKEQAGRLFSTIGAGASAGALIGPAIPTLLATWLGTRTLLLLASALLLPTIPLVVILSRLRATHLGNEEGHAGLREARIGGHPFAGFRNFISNRHLMGIGGFIMLYSAIASIVYFQQKNLLADYSLADRTQILGAIDWIVNIFTFAIAFFATARIVQGCGMPFTLASVPFTISGGLLVLAAAPILAVALALQVARRAANYAITRPAREMLFTQVSREDRFKAKPVIDIVAYRGGDMLTSWGFALLTQGFGFGAAAMAAIGGALAASWGLVAIALGRHFEKSSGEDATLH